MTTKAMFYSKRGKRLNGVASLKVSIALNTNTPEMATPAKEEHFNVTGKGKSMICELKMLGAGN